MDEATLLVQESDEGEKIAWAPVSRWGRVSIYRSKLGGEKRIVRGGSHACESGGKEQGRRHRVLSPTTAQRRSPPPVFSGALGDVC